MLDTAQAAPGLVVRQVDAAEGWSELTGTADMNGHVRTALSVRAFTTGEQIAEFRVLESPEETLGGVFFGIVGSGGNLAAPLGDRGMGVGWGKGLPYMTWVESCGATAGTRKSIFREERYPYHARKQTHNVQEVHTLYSYSVDEVQALLAEWGHKNILAIFKARHVDGAVLFSLDDAALENDYGMGEARERGALLRAISRLLAGRHTFGRGDLVRLVITIRDGNSELRVYKGRQERAQMLWTLLGTPARIPSAPPGGWHFAASVSGPGDVIRARILGEQGDTTDGGAGRGVVDLLRESRRLTARLKAPLPALHGMQGWRAVTGRGAGEYAEAPFMALWEESLGIRLELRGDGHGEVTFQTAHRIGSPDRCAASTNVAMARPTGDFSISAWRAPDLQAAPAEGRTHHARELFLVGGSADLDWTESPGNLGVVPRPGRPCKFHRWRLEFLHGLRSPAAAREGSSGTGPEWRLPLGLYLWLTPAGFLFLGETCALIALHGKPARPATREEATALLSKLAPRQMPVRRGQPALQPPPPPEKYADPLAHKVALERVDAGETPAALRGPDGEMPLGGAEISAVDPRAWARRAVVSAARRVARVAPHSGRPAMTVEDLWSRAHKRRAELAVRERQNEARRAALPAGLLGWEIGREARALARLRADVQAQERTAREAEEAAAGAGARKYPPGYRSRAVEPGRGAPLWNRRP